MANNKKRKITLNEKNQKREEKRRRKLKKDIIQLSIIAAVVVAIGVVIAMTAVVGGNSGYIDHGDHTHPVTTEGDDGHDHDHEAEEENTKAPDFTVIDNDGNEVKRSIYSGKPMIINFWASWCTYCDLEMPYFEEVYKQHPDVQFMMVNATDGVNETIDDAKSYITTTGYTFPVFYDTSSAAVKAYGVDSFPTTYVIDRFGNIVTIKKGALEAHELEELISFIE